MRSKMFVALCVSAGFLVVGYVLVWMNTPRHCINEESYSCLKVGMSEKQVEQLFGVPAGDYSVDGICCGHDCVWEEPDGSYTKTWETNEFSVWGMFSPQHRLTAFGHRSGVIFLQETFFERFRRRLGL